MCDGLGRQFSYSCPNTTLFQQRMLICDHWYMVNCSKAESDYGVNSLIGKTSSSSTSLMFLAHLPFEHAARWMEMNFYYAIRRFELLHRFDFFKLEIEIIIQIFFRSIFDFCFWIRFISFSMRFVQKFIFIRCKANWFNKIIGLEQLLRTLSIGILSISSFEWAIVRIYWFFRQTNSFWHIKLNYAHDIQFFDCLYYFFISWIYLHRSAWQAFCTWWWVWCPNTSARLIW